MSFLSQEQIDGVAAFVKLGCEYLCLQHWIISLSPDPVDDPGAWASIEDTEGKHVATLKLSVDFPTIPEDKIGESLWHELVHLNLRPIRHSLHPLEDLLGKPAFHVFFRNYDREEELLVHNLAGRLYNDHQSETSGFIKAIKGSPAETDESPEESHE